MEILTILLQILSGVPVSVLVSFFNARVTDSRVRFTVTLLFCVGAGVLSQLPSWTADTWTNAGSVLAAFAAVFTGATSFYKYYFENSSLNEKIVALRKPEEHLPTPPEQPAQPA